MGDYKDPLIEESRIFYRLLITEFNEESTYSHVLQVTAAYQEGSSIYYHQTKERIMIKGRQNFSCTMQLINVRGQNIMTKEIKFLKNTIQEIGIQRYLSADIYFVRFEDRSHQPEYSSIT